MLTSPPEFVQRRLHDAALYLDVATVDWISRLSEDELGILAGGDLKKIEIRMKGGGVRVEATFGKGDVKPVIYVEGSELAMKLRKV